jgi:hypothetical protein
MNPLLSTLPQPPTTSFLLGSDVSLKNLLSNSDRDQVSHPYKTTGKIIVLCIVIFKNLER